MSGARLVLVAAVARNGVIGAAGRLPWYLPGDLARFRGITMGHPLLMGRTTFESIGHPLPGRLTTVLSRQAGFAPLGVTMASNLPTALREADRQANELGATAIMVVGGGAVYSATIGIAQTLLITEVDSCPAGDTLFPDINEGIWQKTSEEEAVPQQGDTCRYRFVRWDRKAPF